MAPRGPVTATHVYTKRQLEEAWIRVGGDKALASTMAAIAFAESKANAEPYGDANLGGVGYTSFGPWQIHTPAHPQYDANKLVSDLDYSAKAALEVSGNSVAGLGAWTTYKNGAYRQHFTEGGGGSTVDASFKLPGQEAVEGATKSALDAIASPFEAIAQGASSTAKLAEVVGEWIAEPLRPLKLVGGGILIYMGIRTLTRTGGASGVSSEVHHQSVAVKAIPVARTAKKLKGVRKGPNGNAKV